MLTALRGSLASRLRSRREFASPSAVLMVLLFATSAGAVPLTFDFEDGLQGWELRGSATRVQTQILGGEWAIFGDGLVGNELTSVSREVDLTGITAIRIDQFCVQAGAGGCAFLGSLRGLDIIENLFVGEIIPFEPTDLSQNPGQVVIDVPDGMGLTNVNFSWLPAIPSNVRFSTPVSHVGFIDNITFIPEPTTALLFGLGLLGLAVARRLGRSP